MAIALKACQEGRKVRFFTAASLDNILLEKNKKGTLNNYLRTLKKVEPIVVDEISPLSHGSGFFHITNRNGENDYEGFFH